MKPSQGFTLIELLVAITVATILMTIGVPSFQTMIQNNRLTTETNRLLTDINYARSEAVKRGKHVILCRSTSPSASTPICDNNGGTAKNWTTGWLIFESISGDYTYDSTNSNYTLLKIGDAATGNVTIKTNSNSNRNLEFKGNGTLDESGVAKFAICDSRGTSKGRLVTVSLTGRLETQTGSLSSCGPF